jgi:hypothetical protein
LASFEYAWKFANVRVGISFLDNDETAFLSGRLKVSV